MKTYEKYKDSGIEWIGDVPEHWEVKKLKHCISINDDALNEITDEDTEIYYVEIGDVNYLTGINNFTTYKFKDAPSRARRVVQNGDVIVSTVRTYLKSIARIKETNNNLIVSTGFAVLRPRNIHSSYLGYFVLTPYFIHKTIADSVGVSYPAINSSNIGLFECVIPSIEEQTIIASYLDRKTTEIDRIIANKQKLIALYEEEKQAIINQAVTKGLWALSGVETPTVQLKDSGVEWLGEIPEHWEVKRLKHLTSNISKGTTPSTIGREILLSGNVRFIKAENIVNNCVVEYPENFIDDDTNEILNRSQLGKDDILFVIAGATIGKVAILDECLLPANTNQAISFIRLKDSRNVRFIWYWLQSSKIQKFLWLQAVQSAQPNLSMENLGNFTIPYPDLNEQQSIVTHIEKECTRLDTIIEKFKKQIVLLQEYRTTLISEVVTGKVKVATES